jgi:MtN3 and saliva related transmembrane protein
MNPFSVLGFTAAVLTTLAFLPQVLKSHKSKETKSVSLSMALLQSSGNFLWLLYAILIKDLALGVANLITFVLAFSLVMLKLKYK